LITLSLIFTALDLSAGAALGLKKAAGVRVGRAG
jgi:hypothetical protein